MAFNYNNQLIKLSLVISLIFVSSCEKQPEIILIENNSVLNYNNSSIIQTDSINQEQLFFTVELDSIPLSAQLINSIVTIENKLTQITDSLIFQPQDHKKINNVLRFSSAKFNLNSNTEYGVKCISKFNFTNNEDILNCNSNKLEVKTPAYDDNILKITNSEKKGNRLYVQYDKSLGQNQKIEEYGILYGSSSLKDLTILDFPNDASKFIISDNNLSAFTTPEFNTGTYKWRMFMTVKGVENHTITIYTPLVQISFN